MVELISTVEQRALLRAVRHLQDAARAAGAKTYEPGVPCKYGHIAKRSVFNNACRECDALQKKQNRIKDPEYGKRELARKHRRLESDPEKREAYLQYFREYNSRYPERRKENRKRWELLNPEKAKQIQTNRRKTSIKYKMLNRANASAHNRRCKHATPPWQTEGELRMIHTLRPSGYTVDHIVPLRHTSVCGLNARGNLQYLTGSANSTKTNNWSETESSDSNAIVPFSWEHFLVISEQS